ncbi:hypothetical protein ISF6_5299 [Piscinibacter sakaiensis]|uniref:Uncharacterized protein n=1 Tax=Piscinibacter sakaiensis TaxID=1547922 RepID=A0A0K8P7Z0_PISS1|nr:hypothetical protein ISF6_5299 [Piscinibacter sakaiensis]
MSQGRADAGLTGGRRRQRAGTPAAPGRSGLGRGSRCNPLRPSCGMVAFLGARPNRSSASRPIPSLLAAKVSMSGPDSARVGISA